MTQAPNPIVSMALRAGPWVRILIGRADSKAETPAPGTGDTQQISEETMMLWLDRNKVRIGQAGKESRDCEFASKMHS